MILREAKQVYVPSVHLEDIMSKLEVLDRDMKINAIKAIRSTYHIGLKDAKDLVEQGWAFLDFVKKIDFPITEEDIQADTRVFNEDAYYEDQHDDLPW